MAKKSGKGGGGEGRSLAGRAGRAAAVGAGRGVSVGVVAGARAAGRNVGTTVFVVLVLAVVVGWVAGRGWLEARVAEHRGGAIDVRVDVPAGVDIGALDRLGADPRALLRQVAALKVTSDPFDRDALREAAVALGGTGWFDGGVEVRREPGGVVRVSGAWRVPTVVVEWAGERYLVASDGSPMRVSDPWRLSRDFLVVEDPRRGPERDESSGVVYGAAWPGGDVQQAIALLRYLSGEGRTDLLARMEAVELAHFGATTAGELRLRTDRGGVIVWGAPVGVTVGSEVDAGEKVRQLRAVLTRHGDLETSGKVIRINLPDVFIDERIGSGVGSNGG